MTIDNGITNGTIDDTASITDILHEMRTTPANVRFTQVCKVCDHYFGLARQKGTSHRVYKTLGMVILVSTSKTLKEKQKHIKSSKC